MKRFFLFSLLCFSLLCVGCQSEPEFTPYESTPPPAAAPASPPAPAPVAAPKPVVKKMIGDLKLSVQVKGNTPGDRVVVMGKTNLPDNTDLFISMERTDIDGSPFQTSPKVFGGEFASESLGPSDGLEPGRYEVSVTVPVASVQPPDVQAVIGKRGENLRGPLVERGTLGTSANVTKKFRVGSAAAASENAGAAKKEARAIYDALRDLERQGRAMEGLRQSSDLNDVGRAGERMRELQPQAEALDARADALPNHMGFDLGVAAIEMQMCVSASGTAMDACRRADESLDRAKKSLK